MKKPLFLCRQCWRTAFAQARSPCVVLVVKRSTTKPIRNASRIAPVQDGKAQRGGLELSAMLMAKPTLMACLMQARIQVLAQGYQTTARLRYFQIRRRNQVRMKRRRAVFDLYRQENEQKDDADKPAAKSDKSKPG